MKRSSWVLTLFFIGLLVVGFLVLILLRPRIVAEAYAPDGSHLCVVQTAGTPYFNTATYIRQSNGKWRWFYLEHEDLPWLGGSIRSDPTGNRLTIVRSGAPLAEYDWTNGTYYIGKDNGRDGSAMPDGWELFNDLRPWRLAKAPVH